jgi:elongation factor Tu
MSVQQVFTQLRRHLVIALCICGIITINSQSYATENKSHLNIAIISSDQSAAKSLAEKIKRTSDTASQPAKQIDIEWRGGEEKKRYGVTINTLAVEVEIANHTLSLSPFSDTYEISKRRITGEFQADLAIMLVPADSEANQEEMQKLFNAIEAANAPQTIVFFDSAKKTTMTMRFKRETVLPILHSLEGPELPTITGSIAGSSDDPAIIQALIDTINKIPAKKAAKDGSFLMPIEDVFSISGRGTVVTGRIGRGTIKVNEEVEIVGMRDTAKTTCTGVEISRKLLDEGETGDNVGILLHGTKRDEVERGQVLSKPGSIKPHTKFQADIYLLKKEEGGRHAPITNEYRPQFYIRTADVTGSIQLPEGTAKVQPGEIISTTVTLDRPMALENELRFAIREKDRTVGAGIITKTIEQ